MIRQEPHLLPPPPPELLEYAAQCVAQAKATSRPDQLLKVAEAEAYQALLNERNPTARWRLWDRWVELRQLLTNHELSHGK